MLLRDTGRGLSLLIISLVLPLGLPGTLSVKATTTGFTFTAAGDFGGISSTGSCTSGGILIPIGSCAYNVVNGILGKHPNFALALGDLGYDSSNPTHWCSNFKSIYPGTGGGSLVLVAGNHDTWNGGSVSYADGSSGVAADTATSESDDPHGFLDNSDGYVSQCGWPSGISWIGSGVSSNGVSCTTTLDTPPSCYSREYYFDYPSGTNPIMRFIVISAGICGSWFNAPTPCPPTSGGQLPASYTGWKAPTSPATCASPPSGSEHYCWLKATIDNAKTAGLWVAVANHKECLMYSGNWCESTIDPFNLSLSEGVDLWLDGHDHSYQRSVQISGPCTVSSSGPPTVTSCPTVNLGLGQGNAPYQKGPTGTVVNTIGTGGRSIDNICSSGCPVPANEFASLCGANGVVTNLPQTNNCTTGGDYGFMYFTVDTNHIGAQWVDAASGAAFSDSYSIQVANPQVPGDFSVYPSPGSITIQRGVTTQVAVSLNSFGNFAGTVTLSAPSPTGITTSFVLGTTMTLTAGGTASNTLNIGASSSVALGTYTVTLTGTTTSPSLTSTHSFPITVNVVSSGGGGGSVASGTLITRGDGSKVPVQNLQAGDSITMYDVYSGESLPATLTSIRVVNVDNMLSIQTAGTDPVLRVDANPRLKFYVWTVNGPILKPVTTLQTGDLLYSYDTSEWVPVAHVTITYGGSHAYYDLMTNPELNVNGQFLSFIASGIADPCTTGCKEGPGP